MSADAGSVSLGYIAAADGFIAQKGTSTIMRASLFSDSIDFYFGSLNELFNETIRLYTGFPSVLSLQSTQ